jgi:hypothetical protein
MRKMPKQESASVTKEIIFQIILHLVVFSFYAIDRKNPQIEESEVVFFINLAVVAFVINYVFLPRFFYKKKYLTFALAAVGIIAFTLVMEELVLEQIYFPETRGTSFPGIFYTLLSILPVVTILVGFHFGWDAFRKERELEKLQGAVKESELQFLKSQINPHFLFNNLNNLYAHAIENSPKTPDIILELSAVLRYMLYDCKAEYVPLGKEVEHIENFMKISELQIEDRGSVGLTVENVSESYQIAPLLLIVFIENAFKHSTASQTDNISIAVDIRVEKDGVLKFSCVNSYHPHSNIDSLSSGIGLENVRKRLDLLYPQAHELVIHQGENRFEVILSLALKKAS